MNKQQMIREFFRRRFNCEPEQDRGYYAEWVSRFETGHPETHMDPQSKQVYKQLLEEQR